MAAWRGGENGSGNNVKNSIIGVMAHRRGSAAHRAAMAHRK